MLTGAKRMAVLMQLLADTFECVASSGIQLGNPFDGRSSLGMRLNRSFAVVGVDVTEWIEQDPNAMPLHIHSTGYVTPEQMGIETQPLQMTTQPSPDGTSFAREFAPGWYIVGLTQLVDPHNPFHQLLKRESEGSIGYSMRIYHVYQIQPSDGDAAAAPDVGPDHGQ